MDFFKKVEFEIENIIELCAALNVDKYTYSYAEKIREGIIYKSSDIESYVYCLKKISLWIEENKYHYFSSDKEFIKLKDIIFSLIQSSENSKAIETSIEFIPIESKTGHLLPESQNNELAKNIIFLSHSSNDKKYGDAIRNFLSGIGVKDDCLIYTSHPNHKIPLDENIFDYLRKKINQNVYMIILWSDSYLGSPYCMNELGALWIIGGNYTNVFVPGFDFKNPKFNQCAVDKNKIGITLNNNSVCKTRLIELKNNVARLFNLSVNEEKTTYLIEEFMKEIED